MSTGPDAAVDVQEPIDRLLRDLRTSRSGLTEAEASLRLLSYGTNVLAGSPGSSWRSQLLQQFTQPLAVLLLLAGGLAAANDTPELGIAILGVVVLNAFFAFVQERHAEHAVAALSEYLPARAVVVRAGRRTEVDAVQLVPGDLLVVTEGDRISADGRLVEGSVEVDLSTLTGESEPQSRSAAPDGAGGPLVEANDMVFSGCACLGGDALAVITGTGMRTEIGRIAALSGRGKAAPSPLELQIRDVARLIAAVAVVAALALIPLGLLAGLGVAEAIGFSIAMLVANVPEGLLPLITLALAVGVRKLAGEGAVVKRLSAVETLGATAVVCTDKTGTLTQNRMRAVAAWTILGSAMSDAEQVVDGSRPPGSGEVLRRTAVAAASCSTADRSTGDPTEVALVRFAEAVGVVLDAHDRDENRAHLYRFDPRLRLMTTLDRTGASITAHVKGAPEQLLERCRSVAGGTADRALTDADRAAVQAGVDAYTARGLRVIAVAERTLDGPAEPVPERDQVERDLTLLGLVALLDPPRDEVVAAIARAHAAGIQVHVVTGDNGATASEIARQVGIGSGPGGSAVVAGAELDAMSDEQLDQELGSGRELVFARSSPDAKLRIAQRIRAQGVVVAMTGDGVNDAPALRAADIGVAMGRSGTEVARQAATIVLTDDDFTTIIDAVEEGRRVYDNVRKFVFYILSHSVPEVLPFVLYALSGGAIPLPLTVMQILAIDLVTDTLPALALSREPAEPGLMERPPRSRREPVVGKTLLWRAWGPVGLVSAALVLIGFFAVLLAGGWQPGEATGPGSDLHQTYVQATTVTWLGIVMCQVGTAIAARSQLASLRSIGFLSNPLLLVAIVAELLFGALIIWVPGLQSVFNTTGLAGWQLLLVAPFPVLVWGVDELLRWRWRSRAQVR